MKKLLFISILAFNLYSMQNKPFSKIFEYFYLNVDLKICEKLNNNNVNDDTDYEYCIHKNVFVDNGMGVFVY